MTSSPAPEEAIREAMTDADKADATMFHELRKQNPSVTYTCDEMREACRINYNAALAEAAAACERLIATHRIKVGTYAVAANEDRKCAAAIRALMEKAP